MAIVEKPSLFEDGRGYMPPAQSTEWGTPQDLFDGLNGLYRFTLDPCASAENAKCRKFFTKEDDGLSKSWDGERVFMNPPYGRGMGVWVEKAAAARGGIVVCLLPSRTDVRWFHDFIYERAKVKFIKGRLTFEGAPAPAPFPSMIVTFRPSLEERLETVRKDMDRLLGPLDRKHKVKGKMEPESKDIAFTVLHVRRWRNELFGSERSSG